MTEDKLSLQETTPQSSCSTSTSKLRKKRKWDQPAEYLVSCGAVLPGILPMSTVGCTGVPLPGVFSASCAPSISSVVQQQTAAVVQKLNQPKIQEDLIIAREIVINDADPAMRYKLTKRQTQEEIQKCTGAVVITRGKYRPPNAAPDGEKSLYLHISAGAHLKETVERIRAVDRAAALVEDMLKQVPQPLSTCIYLGFDVDPSLNIAARIRGPNDQYINHIINETGATIVLRGRGSGYLGNTLGEDEQQPLHLLLTSNNQKSLEDAKLLAENLMDTISRECGANRVSSCKVYGAVPPPQQLLVGFQSSRTEMHSIVSSAASMASSSVISVPGVHVPSPVAPVRAPAFSYAQVAQPGALLPPVHAQTNGLSYSQPLSTACTSYSAYAGIYPQATPLQQVAIALRQSSPVSTTIASTTSTTTVISKGSSESEKRPQPKRKFQESPIAFKEVAVSNQELNLQEKCRSPPFMEKKNGAALSPVSLKNLLPPPPRSSSERSSELKSMRPPPPPSKSMLPPPTPPRSMHPPPPPPPPKFSVSVSNSKANSRDNSSGSSSTPAVPDTLVKLMEYGDDDEDDEDVEEKESEFLKNVTDGGAPSKPFWAL